MGVVPHGDAVPHPEILDVVEAILANLLSLRIQRPRNPAPCQVFLFERPPVVSPWLAIVKERNDDNEIWSWRKANTSNLPEGSLDIKGTSLCMAKVFFIEDLQVEKFRLRPNLSQWSAQFCEPALPFCLQKIKYSNVSKIVLAEDSCWVVGGEDLESGNKRTNTARSSNFRYCCLSEDSPTCGVPE